MAMSALSLAKASELQNASDIFSELMSSSTTYLPSFQHQQLETASCQRRVQSTTQPLPFHEATDPVTTFPLQTPQRLVPIDLFFLSLIHDPQHARSPFGTHHTSKLAAPPSFSVRHPFEIRDGLVQNLEAGHDSVLKVWEQQKAKGGHPQHR
ncbi:hypothetical protein PRZ48_000254 [Zasmidium cellare]|uniref:Uncharacterized protein n=1 Tax=Zasmidium cellare TaxID=395010 RepID=A0ABR0EYA9_ZASCE|nr:hypothetical protein PRZ48_000254 [Zasmidium cellare]